MTITTLASINNKTTKVKRLKEARFCIYFLKLIFFAFLLSRFCFVVFFFFNTFVKPRKFFILKNLVIIFKLNTIEKLYYTERFYHNLSFSWFLSCPRAITKEQHIYIYIYTL